MAQAMGKTVLVTGANGALGRTVVDHFLGLGYRVLATAHQAHADDPRPGVEWIEVDLADPSSVESRLAPILAREPVEALLHCAGGFRYGALTALDWKDVKFLWEANLASSLVIARAVLPGMMARKRGHLVFVGAKGVLQPAPGMSAYAAMKAGLHALAASLDEEVRPHGIRVNALLPGIIDTPANRRDMPQADFSSWVRPEDLAELMHRLMTEDLRSVHGALIPVSGRL